MRRRAAIACLLFVLPTVALSVARSRDSAGDGAKAVIYADETWYRERPEPEQTWQGTLQRRAVVDSPGGRPGLTFSLQTTEADLPVYAAGASDRLTRYVGTRVLITGKLVDLRVEGFGRELWIGTIDHAVAADQGNAPPRVPAR